MQFSHLKCMACKLIITDLCWCLSWLWLLPCNKRLYWLDRHVLMRRCWAGNQNCSTVLREFCPRQGCPPQHDCSMKCESEMKKIHTVALKCIILHQSVRDEVPLNWRPSEGNLSVDILQWLTNTVFCPSSYDLGPFLGVAQLSSCWYHCCLTWGVWIST